MSFLQRLLGGRAARPMDEQGFARAYAEAARRRFPDARVEIGATSSEAGTKIEWTLPDGTTTAQFLGNTYAAYTRAPADLDAIIAMHLDAVPVALPDPATRRANILPLVKTRLWLSNSTRQMAQAGMAQAPFITEPLADDLLTVYVEDRPAAMNYVSPADLQAIGLEPGDLHGLALENMRRFLPEITVEGGNGRFGVRLDGNYDASLVFLSDAWRDRVEIDGEPVMALPSRDELLVCGDRDAGGARALRDMAARIMAQSPYGLSALLYTWRDGRLAVYEG